MRARPITLKQAREFVSTEHRHNADPSGCKFAVGAEKDGVLCGVAVAGRPVARLLDDGDTLEITRVATDGTRNACSFLYATVARIARLMGYRRVITYTLAKEPGSSLRAVGAREVARVAGGEWDRKGRRRKSQAVFTEQKIRWEL